MSPLRKTPAWRVFETLGADIQRKLAPSATVTEHERITGVSGVVRTIDITVRHSLGAYPVLVAADFKRHTPRGGVSYIAACAEQARDVGANIAVVVSNSGFTKGAGKVARANRAIRRQRVRFSRRVALSRTRPPTRNVVICLLDG